MKISKTILAIAISVALFLALSYVASRFSPSYSPARFESSDDHNSCLFYQGFSNFYGNQTNTLYNNCLVSGRENYDQQSKRETKNALIATFIILLGAGFIARSLRPGRTRLATAIIGGACLFTLNALFIRQFQYDSLNYPELTLAFWILVSAALIAVDVKLFGKETETSAPAPNASTKNTFKSIVNTLKTNLSKLKSQQKKPTAVPPVQTQAPQTQPPPAPRPALDIAPPSTPPQPIQQPPVAPAPPVDDGFTVDPK